MTLHLVKLPDNTLVDIQASVIAECEKPKEAYARFGKRALDIVLVLLAMPIVLPLLVVLTVVILVTGNAPFYSQLRVGKGGQAFRMWKLRTMVQNADQYLEEYLQSNPSARIEWDSTQKLKNDPRITPIGRILRKTSVDELPQLFNVLFGTMSLVGPRPMMMGQQEYYDGKSYYEMSPGITGLWQVSDRNECDFKDRVAFDNTYLRVRSLKADLKLLVQTVGVVCRATGH